MPPDAQPARPLIIAHRAGNNLADLSEAFAVGVDYAETDVWFHRGRLEVRHDKTAGPLPFLWDRWSLKPSWEPRLLLDEVLAAASRRGRLFLDLKGRETGLADAMNAAIERADAVGAVAFCGGWRHLDRLRELVPQAPALYTVGTLERLEELRPRLARQDVKGVSHVTGVSQVTGVSIDSRILTASIVSDLKEAGVETFVSWHVETEETARRLLSWGVNGFTSDSLALLTAIREGRIEASTA